MIAWRDGDWIEDGDVLPADDRGLTLGDGLFETLLAVDGRLAQAGLHFRRLRDAEQRPRQHGRRRLVARDEHRHQVVAQLLVGRVLAAHVD